MSKKKFTIYRYNPEVDTEPYMQDYELDLSQVNGKMVLHAIEALKEQDPTLSIRRSCGEAVCGSDGMNINGKNRLACMTSVTDLPDHIILRPLPGFPVIRDLIVDMTQFFEHYGNAKLYLTNDKEQQPAKEFIQSPEDREKLDGLYECILCACCSSSCPSYWWNPEDFLSPAILLCIYRFIADTRDTATEERLSALQDAFSLFRCRTIMNCVDVCPKGLNPAKAIGHIRRELLKKAV